MNAGPKKRIVEFKQKHRVLAETYAIQTQFEIKSISDIITTVIGDFVGDDIYWYRGHGNIDWQLTPGVFRYREKQIARKLLDEFKRLAEIKIRRVPNGNDAELQWMQIAQHNGLPTQLLDWTKNILVALYFACLSHETDGALFLMQADQVNWPRKIFNAEDNWDIINGYIHGMGRKNRPALAIEPSMNNERILLQQGCFTLHANSIPLNSTLVGSLMCIPIFKEDKANLTKELLRLGFGEMQLFPEIEHVCSHLVRTSGLTRIKQVRHAQK